MMQPWELSVAGRYLRSGNKNRFISFISLISVAGIAIAVAVLIVVLSVMNGFEHEVRTRILSVLSHGSISSVNGGLADWRRLAQVAGSNPATAAVAPYVSGQGILVAGERTKGAEVRGVLPESEARASDIGRLMSEGGLETLRAGEYGIVLGRGLAEALGIGPGDRVILMVPQGIATPAGLVPRMRRFTVTGIFYAGMYQFDTGLALVHAADAQRLYRTGDAMSGVRLAFDDPLMAPVLVREIALEYGDRVYVGDWTRQHANFFRSIQLTRSIIFVILLLVVGVAAFNIVSTLVMVVRDKRPEIAILRTMGASRRAILALFMAQGTLTGFLGTLIGAAAGILLSWQLGPIVAGVERMLGLRFLAPDIYFISDFPSRLEWSDVTLVSGIALLLGFASTLYPAWRGATTAPAEALRHD